MRIRFFKFIFLVISLSTITICCNKTTSHPQPHYIDNSDENKPKVEYQFINSELKGGPNDDNLNNGKNILGNNNNNNNNNLIKKNSEQGSSDPTVKKPRNIENKKEDNSTHEEVPIGNILFFEKTIKKMTNLYVVIDGEIEEFDLENKSHLALLKEQNNEVIATVNIHAAVVSEDPNDTTFGRAKRLLSELRMNKNGVYHEDIFLPKRDLEMIQKAIHEQYQFCEAYFNDQILQGKNNALLESIGAKLKFSFVGASMGSRIAYRFFEKFGGNYISIMGSPTSCMFVDILLELNVTDILKYINLPEVLKNIDIKAFLKNLNPGEQLQPIEGLQNKLEAVINNPLLKPILANPEHINSALLLLSPLIRRVDPSLMPFVDMLPKVINSKIKDIPGLVPKGILELAHPSQKIDTKIFNNDNSLFIAAETKKFKEVLNTFRHLLEGLKLFNNDKISELFEVFISKIESKNLENDGIFSIKDATAGFVETVEHYRKMYRYLKLGDLLSMTESGRLDTVELQETIIEFLEWADTILNAEGVIIDEFYDGRTKEQQIEYFQKVRTKLYNQLPTILILEKTSHIDGIGGFETIKSSNMEQEADRVNGEITKSVFNFLYKNN